MEQSVSRFVGQLVARSVRHSVGALASNMYNDNDIFAGTYDMKRGGSNLGIPII